MVSRAGFSLVEVIVALVLLAVAVLGAAATGLLAGRFVHDAEAYDEAANRAAFLLDSLLADSVHGIGSSRTPTYSADWSATGDSAAVTIRMRDSATYTLRAIR